MVRSTLLHDLSHSRHSHHSRNRRSRKVLHIRSIGRRPMRRRQWREEERSAVKCEYVSRMFMYKLQRNLKRETRYKT